MDKDGTPKYRLLGTNARDPLHNRITDLNGDQVDDIVLVDKRGVPAIVNGYKLVLASPYKKVWKTTHATREDRLREPFNEWLAKQFSKSIDSVNWREGKYVLSETQDMQKLTSVYGKKGLPKPRISKRLTPNGYWASAFSHVWRLFWNSDAYSDPVIQTLKRATNYLTVANTIFIYYFDQPMKYSVEQSQEFGGKFLTYAQWATWRRVNKDKYNGSLGPAVVKFVKETIGTAVNLETGDLIEEDGGKWHPKLQQLIGFIETIIFDWGFGMALQDGMKRTRNQPAPFEDLANDMYAGQLQDIKKDWSQMVSVHIQNIIYQPKSGYMKYKAEAEVAKNKRRDEAKVLVNAKNEYY